MKSLNLTIVAVALWAIPICNDAAFAQDLDRINDIISQARGLADSARSAQSPSPAQTTTSSPAGLANPFSNRSQSPANSGVSVGSVTGPGVDVNDQQIRVNAGGQQFVIPRVGNPSSPAVPGLANGRTTVDDALRRVAGYQTYANAVQLFRAAEFQRAAVQMQGVAIENQDPRVLHPFHSLCLFANGQYIRSAELAYSAASLAPVWGWEQLKGYYSNPNDYAQQYQALQTAAQSHNADVSVRFLLGYHHLMLGHRGHAIQQFELVLKQLPNDPVTKHLMAIANQGPPEPMN